MKPLAPKKATPVYAKTKPRRHVKRSGITRGFELMAQGSDEAALVGLGIETNDAGGFANLALRYLHSGDDESAFAASNIAIAADPDGADRASSATAWFVRGCVNGRRKQNADALAAFERVVHLRPDDVAAWTFIGELHLTSLSYEAAAHAFERALKLDPQGTTAAGQRAHALVAKTLMTI